MKILNAAIALHNPSDIAYTAVGIVMAGRSKSALDDMHALLDEEPWSTADIMALVGTLAGMLSNLLVSVGVAPEEWCKSTAMQISQAMEGGK